MIALSRSMRNVVNLVSATMLENGFVSIKKEEANVDLERIFVTNDCMNEHDCLTVILRFEPD